MSIDILQEKIRKLKNPTIVDLSILPEHIPSHIRKSEEPVGDYLRFCRELLEGLKDLVPGVRLSFGQLALMGGEGLAALSELTRAARQLGYYVILDSTEILTPWSADRAAAAFFGENSQYPCDALVMSPYIGSDALKSFAPYCREGKKALFPAVRTPNKSASELQDLLTGSRHVHTAAVDILSRTEETMLGKFGYSNIGALAAAGTGNVLKNLRAKYPRLFLLVDGYDYPGGNAKNASLAFDGMGRCAAVCAGPSITAAWYMVETDGTDFVEQAVLAAQRMKRTLGGYLTFL